MAGQPGAAELLDPGDLPPLSADELQHFAWLASSSAAVPVLSKPQLGRLLDDRARLIAALLALARSPVLPPSIREAAERVLLRVDG